MGMLDSLTGGLSDSLGGILNAATLGLVSAGGTLLGNKQSHGYNKQLLKLQQYFAERNAWLAHQYEQENLATTGCQARQQQEAAYQYDRLLAKYSQQLNKLSAEQDYQRAIKYIADSQAAYKNALVANGYNPLLALSSSIPSYSGHTNSAVGGSVSAPVGSASTSAVPHASGAPSSPYSDYGASFSRGLTSALDFARTASDIKRNESASIAERASAAKDLEQAKTFSEHRDPETFKTYSSAGRDILGSLGTAAGGYYLHGKTNQLMDAIKAGNRRKIQSATSKVVEDVAREGNSAFLGSRALQAIMPVLFATPAAYGLGKATEHYNEKYRKPSDVFARPNPWIATGFGL